jgi:hypothetical protein
MTANFKLTAKRHSSLMFGSVLSVALLAVFLYLQHRKSSALDLDLIWLIVAATPLFLALLLGGYLRKVKGLGIELQRSLQNPVGRVHVLASNGLEDLPADQMGSNEYLFQLPEAKRREIQRLAFVVGRSDYYDSSTVKEYLEKFPNAKFIEVCDANGRFQCLLPARIFGYKNHFDDESIDRFIESLRQHKVTDVFPFDVITQTISEDESVLESYEKIRSSDLSFLPLVSEGGRLLGIVNRDTLEKRIVDEIIAAHKRA